ncbi:hypothetical protein ACFE04_000081 [Oxalis oulophora]
MAEEEASLKTQINTVNMEPKLKRDREEEDSEVVVVVEGEGEAIKKPKLEVEVHLGPKIFGSSLEMFDYFFKLLHYWPRDVNLNKFEQMVLLDLITKGHEDPQEKIGAGIEAFQVRFHPTWKNKCFFVVRKDDSIDSFSFRKYVDYIIPLPEEMKVKHDANKGLGAQGGRGGNFRGGGGGGGRGRGRGRDSK